MKCIRVDLPEDIAQLKIEIFSDLHIGSKKCDFKAIQERIEKVKNNPNTYCILLGDLFNCSIIGSCAEQDLYESPISPMQQLEVGLKLFKPISHKIIGVVSGNHELRLMKAGMDLMLMFCNELGITEYYNPIANLLFIRFGKQSSHKSFKKICYTLYMSHGSSNGGTSGSKANQLSRRGNIVDADIVVVGHTHMPMTFRESTYQINYQTSCVVTREIMYVNASATIGYESYAEKIGCRPNSIVSPVIILDGHTRKMQTII